ncbi:MAG TPA: response regulator transcription factor [Candidatus Sulfotelmatobacter sp.]|nr:response regulator transcription factor [Candidatus Sulfotelmatobacter sp.]
MYPHAQVPDHKTIRCVLVHEVALVRQGLRRLLEDERDLEVVAEAENAAEALRQILEYRPDAVIADVRVFGCPPPQAEKMILRESPNSRVVFLPGTSPNDQWPTASEHTRFAGRQTSVSELFGMVRGSAASTEVTSSHGDVREFPGDPLSSGKWVLTAREREVLKLLAEGRTVRSVAAILGLSVKTVDAHKFNLMRKLGIHNKAELVMWAIQKKVVKLPVNF